MYKMKGTAVAGKCKPGAPRYIRFPDNAGSAIVFVNAPGPSPHAFTFRVFNLKN